MNLTAKEQYELVKDHPEVWRRDLKYWDATGNPCFLDHHHYHIPPYLSDLILTALFMLAGGGYGMGVVFLGDDKWHGFDMGGAKEGSRGHDSPLAAAVAAYKRRSGT